MASGARVSETVALSRDEGHIEFVDDDEQLRIFSQPGLTFELADSKGTSWRRDVDLLDLGPKSDVKEVVNSILLKETCAAGQRNRVERLVGRLVNALQVSTTNTFVSHRKIRAHSLPLTNVALNKDATLCATGSYDRQCRLWRTCDGSIVAKLEGHEDVVFDVTFIGKQDELVATCSFDGSLRAWNTDNGSCELVMVGHEGPVATISPLPTSKQFLFTGGMDTTAKIWDLHMGECITSLSGHHGAVINVGGDRSGLFLYTASFDGTVRLWDVRTYESVKVLDGHEGELNGAALSWCGHFIASWATDASVLIWDIRKADQPIYTLRHDAEQVLYNIHYAGRYAKSNVFLTYTSLGACDAILTNFNAVQNTLDCGQKVRMIGFNFCSILE
ncbi:dynein assembly factor with WD repeat domains 1-like [Palaemon carinicauda]|uniref:dynein assembly factor with WD repeat domains 1-like n=1 Tax=Palaemon carinicauda TaxID=392227 RepID=UPI0035B606CF